MSLWLFLEHFTSLRRFAALYFGGNKLGQEEQFNSHGVSVFTLLISANYNRLWAPDTSPLWIKTRGMQCGRPWTFLEEVGGS